MTDASVSLRVGTAFTAFLLIGAVEAALGVLLPSLLETFALSTATVTPLLASQIGGYGLAAVLSGIVINRLGLGRMLVTALAVLAAALTLYALTPRWDLMVAGGVALGLGIGLIDAGINTALARRQDAARLIGPLHGFYGVGAFIGPLIATTLLAHGNGWRPVYAVLAGLVSLLLLGIRHSRRACAWRGVPLPVSENWRFLAKAVQRPSVQMSSLFLLGYVGIEASIGTWAFSVQHLARSESTVSAGLGVSLYWVGLTAGRFCFGALVERTGVVRLTAGSLALALAAQIGWLQGIEPRFTLPLMGFALAAIYPATILLIPHRLPDRLVPAAIGVATAAGSFGSVVVPASLGWIAAGIGLSAVPSLLVALVLGLAGLYGLVLSAPEPANTLLPFLSPWSTSD
jgi:fucose permease